MKRIDSLLADVVDQKEALRMARAQKAFAKWSEVVGPVLAGKSHPDRYERGTVWVAVEGSAWAQELRLLKDKILYRLREVSGEGDLFQNIRFGVRPVAPGRPEPSETPPDLERGAGKRSIREIARKWLADHSDEERA